MATRNPQDASVLTGVALTFFAATVTTGDATVGGQGVVLIVLNGSGSPITCTLTTPETVEGTLAVADRPVTVAAGAYQAIPVPSRYNDSTTGLATFICSSVTTVTFAVLRASTTA